MTTLEYPFNLPWEQLLSHRPAIIFPFLKTNKQPWHLAIKFSEIVIETHKTKDHQMFNLYTTQETREKKSTALLPCFIVKLIDTKESLNIQTYSKYYIP